MIKALVVLLDSLTNYQAVADLVHAVFLFGVANTGIVFVLVSFMIVRRWMIRRNGAAPSRA